MTRRRAVRRSQSARGTLGPEAHQGAGTAPTTGPGHGSRPCQRRPGAGHREGARPPPDHRRARRDAGAEAAGGGTPRRPRHGVRRQGADPAGASSVRGRCPRACGTVRRQVVGGRRGGGALRRTVLELREDDEGTCHGKFRIPALHGQILRKFILALDSPARPTHPERDHDLSTPVRHGLAFCQLLEAIPGKSLPKAGGCSATIVVTMTLEQLLANLDAAGVCTLDTGGQISASDARRLACTAGIIPAVLGGKSEVLDVGRKSRFHREPQRIAMIIRDGGCTEVDCDRPPSMCHAHHDIPWSAGGRNRRGARPPALRPPPQTHSRPPIPCVAAARPQSHVPPAELGRSQTVKLSGSSPSTSLWPVRRPACRGSGSVASTGPRCPRRGCRTPLP